MSSKLYSLTALSLTAALTAGCGGDHSAPAPEPPTAQALDTAQVLLLARQMSETSVPFAVNGGMVTLNDTSETSAPIAVNAM